MKDSWNDLLLSKIFSKTLPHEDVVRYVGNKGLCMLKIHIDLTKRAFIIWAKPPFFFKTNHWQFGIIKE